MNPHIVQFEADSRGRIYAELADGSVRTTRMTVPTLAGRSEITRDDLRAALKTMREPLGTPCPECGDFDCLVPLDPWRTRARCIRCGAEVEEVFYV